MGILNVTPDSFSGSHPSLDEALRHAERMVAEGADIIDIGGESTRPGSASVGEAEELRRTLPVIEGIRARFPIRLSIDTQKFEVAKQAIGAGASIVNDVSGGADVRMARLAAQTGADYIVMHMQGTPKTMQLAPEYPRGVVLEVHDYLKARAALLGEAGLPAANIWVDPGFGFGKTLEQNLELLKGLESFIGIGARVVVGTSRKSFLARLLGNPALSFEAREAGTLASNLFAHTRGASVFRVHCVGEFRRALSTWEAVCG